jgi:hypothetical protein
MKLPDEFQGRVIKTRLSGLPGSFKQLTEIRRLWPEVTTDVMYESGGGIVVLVFENTEDALAFKLKFGEDYV